METDEGERRFTWREYRGNVAAWKDDRGSTMWKYEQEPPPPAVGEKMLQWFDSARTDTTGV